MALATITTDDLKSYALWLAGEPVDGSSDYDERVVQHMQLVYNCFVNGGSLGTRDVATAAGLYSHLVDIPTTDWLWLRKFPNFAFVTTPVQLGSGSGLFLNQATVIGTVLLTYGSDVATFSIAPAISVEGWRLKPLTQAQGIANPPITVPRIAAHIAAALTATLDTPWNQETQTLSNYVLFQAEYALPTDFVRFCESWAVQGGAGGINQPRLAMGSFEQVSDYYPLNDYNQGPPSAAARLTPETMMVNRWDTFSYRCEGSYIFQPDALAVGETPAQQPLVPVRFRHILALGAAMMITADKVDSRAGSLSSQFREVLAHMGAEVRHEQNAGSELQGRHLTRMGQMRRRGLRTTSGLPFF